MKEKEMKTFFTSDLHFGHLNIITYCNRPFRSLEGMDKALIWRWNDVVGKNDRVFVLGDFSFYNKEKTAQVLSQLNGYKILIKGNHDRSCKAMIELGFDEAHLEGEYEGYYLSHYPTEDDIQSLCGHVHDMWVTNGNRINVGADVWGYRPNTLEKILEKI